MADNSLKQFLVNGGQFPHQLRQRSNSGGVTRELMKKQGGGGSGGGVRGGSDSHLTDGLDVGHHGRRMSLGSLTASRLSIASSIGSYNDTTIRQMEESGELSHQGEDSGRGKMLLSFHYCPDILTLTVKVIEAKDLRSIVHGGDICAFATIGFLPTSSTSRLETKVRTMTSNPVWKEVFRIRNFPKDSFNEHKALVVEVWDKTANGSSQLIGEAVILLRSLTIAELQKGIVMWKYLSQDRQESELSLGELTVAVRQSQRKKRLTIKIERVSNAAIPVSATTPCLYMKLMLLRGDTVALTDRTRAVSNSYSPVFNHKTRISLLTNSLRGASVKLLLKQEQSARVNNLRRGSIPSVQHYFQKTVGVIHLGETAEREDLRVAWQRILDCRDRKLHFTLKFSAPRSASIEN